MDLYGWIFVALDSLLNSNLVYKNLLTKVFNDARKVCAKTTRWKLTSEMGAFDRKVGLMGRKEIITTVSLILNKISWYVHLFIFFMLKVLHLYLVVLVNSKNLMIWVFQVLNRDFMFLHVTYAFQSESTLYSCSKQARNLKVKWLKLDSNPEPLSS